MEDFTKLLRERLFAAFYNWLDVNEDAIGKWYEDLYRKGRDTEASCNTLMKIIGDAMWMLTMISNLGVYAGVGPNNFDLQLARALEHACRVQQNLRQIRKIRRSPSLRTLNPHFSIGVHHVKSRARDLSRLSEQITLTSCSLRQLDQHASSQHNG